MENRPFVIPPPVSNVPLRCFEPHSGTGRFQSSTPLKASRATRNHVLGTVSSTPVSVSSQIQNTRPAADTIALTDGVYPWLRAQSGPAVH